MLRTLEIKLLEQDQFLLSTEGHPGGLLHEDHIRYLVDDNQLSRLEGGEVLSFTLEEF
jgi:hypothetical protein